MLLVIGFGIAYVFPFLPLPFCLLFIPFSVHFDIVLMQYLSQVIGVITPFLVGNNPGDANLGAKVFFLWGALCSISVVFTYFLVPEMKGLSLEQVDKMLEEVSPRHSSKWRPSSTFAMDMGVVGKGFGVGEEEVIGDGEVDREGLGMGMAGMEKRSRKGAHVESVQLSPKARG